MFQLSDYNRWHALWVKIEGKRMIARIKSYGGLKKGTIGLLCPNCLSGIYVKFGTYSRKMRYYLGSLRSIFVQRYRCKNCKTTFSDLNPIVSRLRRYAKKALRDIVDIKLWMGAGLGKIANWKRVHGCSSTLIWNELQKLGKLCKKPFLNLKCARLAGQQKRQYTVNPPSSKKKGSDLAEHLLHKKCPNTHS